MRALNSFSDVYLHLGVSDMRFGVDRLALMIEEELGVKVFSGGIFVFVSRTRKKIKLLYWDRDGYAVWMKRLEAGVFRLDKGTSYDKITGVDLELLLSGVELKRIKFAKHVEETLPYR